MFIYIFMYMFSVLLIDALRIHKKYQSMINKDFNDPLANWINHSKFRLLQLAEKRNTNIVAIV
jgi:hypothetical protein